MATNYVAAADGVLVRVGNAIVGPLYTLDPVPEGADKDHVGLLVDRGLLVATAAPDTDDGSDSKSAASSRGGSSAKAT